MVHDFTAAPYTKTKCAMVANTFEIELPYTITCSDGSTSCGKLRITKAHDVNFEVEELEKYPACPPALVN